MQGKKKNNFGPGTKFSLYIVLTFHIFLKKIIEVQLLCYCVVLCLFLLFSNMNRLLLFSHSIISDYLCNPWTVACRASLSFTISQSLLKLMSIKSVMPSNHLILCRPLLLPPSIFPRTRVFFNESVLWIRWLKYQCFSFSINPSNEYSGLLSFRINWFDLLSVHGTLKSLLHNARGSARAGPQEASSPGEETRPAVHK